MFFGDVSFIHFIWFGFCFANINLSFITNQFGGPLQMTGCQLGKQTGAYGVAIFGGNIALGLINKGLHQAF